MASKGDLGALRAQLSERGVSTVHLVLQDLDGGLRERRIRLADLERTIGKGTSFCDVLYQWDVGDSVFTPGPFLGEAIAADVDSLRGYPFEPHAAWVVADFAGPSAAVSPRRILQAQIDRAAALGLSVRVGFEFEWLLYRETAESLRAKAWGPMAPFAPDNRCWDAVSAAINADLIAEHHAVLDAADIPLVGLGMELGAGCLEASLGTTGAMAAADNAAFFKAATKAFYRRKGMSACFMAQPDLGAPGLSGHIHLSLADGAGRELFRGPSETEPTEAARHFIGGTLALLPELAALPLHTVNAWRRLSPGNWAPRTATWSVQNYSTGIRAVLGDHPGARLEFRIPGADVHPHLGLAMYLAAGLTGLEQKIEPLAPVTGDGRLEVPPGTPALPRDLHAAAEALHASATARRLFGDAFVERFAASRFHEFDSLRRAVSAAERARYFEAV